MAPYFSIILPVYNVEKYLQRCVRSVQNQSFSDYEIILVDDGATDSSGELCDKLAAEDPKITVVHKENGGLASARNAGLQKATGRYVWFVDSDDWIEPDALQCLYQASSEQSPDLVKFSYYRVDESRTEVTGLAEPGLYTEESLEKLRSLAFYYTGKFLLSACFCIYRRALITEHRLEFVSERIVGSEDYLFNLQVLLFARSVQVIPSYLYDYEQRDGSLTQKYRPDLAQQYTRLYKELCDSYARAGQLEAYQKRIMRFYVWHLLHSTCIPNEYYVTPSHSLQQGRENIRAFLAQKLCRKAIAGCDKTGLTGKQRVQLVAMRLCLEPVFFRLWKGKEK